MYDSLYPEAADNAMQARALRPDAPTPAPRFSTWGFVSAAPKGIAAGTAQGAASVADVGSAVAQKMPANMTGPFGKIPIMSAAMSAFQVGADIANGPKEGQFTSEVGTSLRNVAQTYTPDPVTTHVSESAVFNLFRMGSKAITAAATMGNLPGAALAGAEEGFTQADELARQGVDIKTRTKVGVVNAAVNAASFALPVAGKTWMQTGALALVGGPASFMAQNAATREILQAADYSKLADQYDPFDPVGLALSTVIPLGFGALAMRGAKVKGKAPEKAPEAMHPPDDVVDAARVSLLRNNMDATNPLPDLGDAHVKAYEQAMEQQAAGERVQVEIPELAAVKATQDMAARMEQLGPEVAARPIEVRPIEVRQEPTGFNPATLAGEASRLLEGGKPVSQVIGELELSGTKVTPEMQNMLVGVSEFGGRIEELVGQVKALQQQRGANAQPFDVIGQAVENMRVGTKIEAPKPVNAVEARLKEVTDGNPSALDAQIPIEFGDDGKPTRTVSAREYIEAVKKEATQDSLDARLLEVAANCFISGGM